jgi:hypothetical protein
VIAARGLVSEVRRTDYAGDRDSLEKLFHALTPHLENAAVAPTVRYWRGFALWRRAFNGFNESLPAAELDHDLSRALAEFDAAIGLDSSFVEARIGAGSCLSNLMFLRRDVPDRANAHLAHGGGRDKAMATYWKALPLARAGWNPRADPLHINWGEPELHMNLAWAHLNATEPNADSAYVYAQAALKRVPFWHYVRDILSTQIEAARAGKQ